MNCAAWVAPEIRRSTQRLRHPPVSQPRLPRDSTGVGALTHKTEIVTNGQHGAGRASLRRVSRPLSRSGCNAGLLSRVCYNASAV